MSCGSKCADRKQKERKRRFNGELGVTHSTRERQRVREREKAQKNSITKNALTQCTCVCVQCTLLYKSLEGLTEVLSYFNALKERLHKSQNIFLTEYLSQPTRYSASSADGPRLLQPTRPMLSLYLNTPPQAQLSLVYEHSNSQKSPLPFVALTMSHRILFYDT